MVVNDLPSRRVAGTFLWLIHFRVDDAYAIPRMVTIRASLFRMRIIFIGALNNTNDDTIHPEIIVPTASRLRDLVRFISSSLEGTRTGNEGFLKKQK